MSRSRSFAFEPVGSDAPENVSPYQLRALVATGAHGNAYLAFSPTGSAVVVKVYRFGFGAEPKARARFLRAVTVARSMHCETAAPVRGAGFTMHRLWLVTDYQQGPSLADAVFRHGPLPGETVRRLAVALTGLVGELHLVGLSGRGLEPSDVVLTPDGPRIVDLGFARVEGEAPAADAVHALRGADGAGATDGVRAADPGGTGGSGGTVGTGIGTGSDEAEPRPITSDIPGRYVSGRAVLARDVRDLGAVLYFAATGRAPAGDTSDILGPGAAGDCPVALRELIAASHRADPARRPSLSELAAAASTAGGSRIAAEGGRSVSWLPQDVLCEAESRGAAVAELRRGESWRLDGLFPVAGPSAGPSAATAADPWRTTAAGAGGAAGTPGPGGGARDATAAGDAKPGAARAHGLHVWRRRSSH